MLNKLKVLIGDNTAEFGAACGDILMDYDFEISLFPNDGMKILDGVKSIWPDIIIVDVFMPQFDAIGLMNEMKEYQSYKPRFIVLSSCSNQFIENDVMRNGASYFAVKPLDLVSFSNRVRSVGNDILENISNGEIRNTRKTFVEEDLECVVTDVMLSLGIPAHVKGYHYIRRSIIMAIENTEIMNSVTKLLYPNVAEIFNTTSSRVERAIRHAIEIAWDRGDVDTLTLYFGYTINNSRGKPTNSEFIAMVSDKIRLQIKRNKLMAG